MTRLQALALWAAVSIPFGMFAHFAAEMGALHRSLFELASSPLHAYFAALAAASLVALVASVGLHDVRRRVALLAHALPFRGHGMAFVGITALLQLAFVAITIGIEGDPVAGGSIVSAIIGCFIAAFIGAFALQIIRSRIEAPAPRAIRIARVMRLARVYTVIAPAFGPYFAFVAARGNRPPPHPSYVRSPQP